MSLPFWEIATGLVILAMIGPAQVYDTFVPHEASVGFIPLVDGGRGTKNHGTFDEGPRNAPTSRDLHATVYDEESDRVIMFGGDANINGRQGELSNETWAYDLNANAWVEKNPASRPPARWFFDSAYDTESDRVIIFGGDVSKGMGGETNDTWAYDFNSNVWEELSSDPRPSPRSFHRLAYDAESDRTVLFGGNFRTGISNETWCFDYNSGSWRNMNPASSPSPRYAYGMSYDSESDRVILFGGFGWTGSEYGLLNDTWAYDLNTNNWTEMSPSGHPRYRGGHDMVYASNSDRILLFGGDFPRIDDTWAYDFNTDTWVDMSPGLRPRARNLHALAYDSESDRLILFGGFMECDVRPQTCQRGRNNETWAYDLNTNAWTPMTVATPPRNLSAIGGTSVVTLTWKPPASDGGSAVANYRVYRGPASGNHSPLVETGGLLSYRDTNLTAGTAYSYRVAAITAVGEGPPTPPEQATPSAPPPVPDTTPPTVTITETTDPALLTRYPVASWAVTFSGIATDNVAVDRVELTTDGVDWVTATGTVSWDGTVTIFEGGNEIRVRAIDTSGNVGEAVSFIDIHGPPLLAVLLIAGLVVGAAASIVVAAIYLKRKTKA